MRETTVVVENSVGGAVWLTAREAAARARCGVKVVYRATKSRRLRAVRITGRRELRYRPSWVDAWLESLVIGEDRPSVQNDFEMGRHP